GVRAPEARSGSIAPATEQFEHEQEDVRDERATCRHLVARYRAPTLAHRQLLSPPSRFRRPAAAAGRSWWTPALQPGRSQRPIRARAQPGRRARKARATRRG